MFVTMYKSRGAPAATQALAINFLIVIPACLPVAGPESGLPSDSRQAVVTNERIVSDQLFTIKR